MFVILLIAWFFPGETIVFLLKQFFPFLLLLAFFLYLFFLVVEYEARKYIKAKREADERNRNLNFLVATGQKISESLNSKKIVRDGFAGLICLLPVKKGFAFAPSQNEEWGVAAAYHLSQKTAEATGRRLLEKRLPGQEEKVFLPPLKDETLPAGEEGGTCAWQNLQVINLFIKKRSLGFLALDTEIPNENVCLQTFLDKLAKFKFAV